MQNEIKDALKEALLQCLPVLHKLGEQFQGPYQVFNRDGNAWRGKTIQAPYTPYVFERASKVIEQASKKFANLFSQSYPQYLHVLIGCSNLIGMQISGNGIVYSALQWLWDKHKTFECPNSSVEAVVSDFEEFIESDTITVLFQAEVINLHIAAENLALAENLAIRRLTEQEVSAFQNLHPRMSFHGICEYVFEGNFQGVKTIAGKPEIQENAPMAIKSRLDKALLCLRTFKSGRVGIGWLYCKSIKFCPLQFGASRSSDHEVIPGSYLIANDEMESLFKHAKYIFNLSEGAMELACARLGDAETRLRPRDQILDAVIGMESLLLPAAGIKGELKYRFSLNYSTLFEQKEEKWRAYKTAGRLYDIRSLIAHGSILTEKAHKFGDEMLTLDEIARRAKESLRMIIKYLLPLSTIGSYKKSEFWERKYFNISEPEHLTGHPLQ